jgi:putative oxidoreductase
MENTDEPKLFLPFLKPLYDVVIPLSWPLVRCTVGVNLVLHGWPKFLRVIELMGGRPVGRESVPWLVWLVIVEFFAGIAITLGLLTRFFAPLAALEMAHLTFIFRDHYHWRTDGYEYVLMWGLILLAVSLRGGGPYSLDRKVGWSL